MSERDEVKDLQVCLDNALSAWGHIETKSRELSLVKTKLDEARMWLDEHLVVVGVLQVPAPAQE